MLNTILSLNQGIIYIHATGAKRRKKIHFRNCLSQMMANFGKVLKYQKLLLKSVIILGTPGIQRCKNMLNTYEKIFRIE